MGKHRRKRAEDESKGQKSRAGWIFAVGSALIKGALWEVGRQLYKEFFGSGGGLGGFPL
ncbi:hypothetical protein ACWDLG_41370 [Nonomuraea sp. NPDC003727]